MLAKEQEKFRMANHILHLFASRPGTFKETSWDCVLRDGQLMVIKNLVKRPTDRVIIHCFLEPGELPHLLSTYRAARKNWQVLVEANFEKPTATNVG